ncbi:MAG: type II toxin-antitoxin system RelB/DinJ family antitoxin [Lachnospiraceae bacterium]|nr:type II toxin-antitoxin system RelB/DinJ family antitoxin [Lachnospiraceae bacterium]
MAQSTISARIDSKDKSDFDNFCNTVGLNASTAINLFIKTVLRERRIPFEISCSPDPFYNEANQAYILKSVNELREGKGHPHKLIEEDTNE